MSRIHIQNGTLVDTLAFSQSVADVFIENGKIASLGQAPQGFIADKVIDAKDKLVLSGLVDLSVRLREVGQHNNDQLDTEMQAALAGGITSFVLGPEMDPILDEPGLVEMLKYRTRAEHHPHVYPLGAMTVGLDGSSLTEMAELTKAGCIAFSQADHPLVQTNTLLQTMKYAKTYNYALWLRPTDASLGNGVMASGAYASRLGLSGIPIQAETIALYTLFELQKMTGVRIHLSQVSSAQGLDLIRAAKKEGLPVTCDVSMNHLHLIDLDIAFYDTNYRLSPPLRSQRDRDAIRLALLDGTIDAICSNHSPINDENKMLPFAEASPGAVGFELLLSLVLKWAQEDNVDLTKALAKITSSPASIISENEHAATTPKHIQAGAVADLCIVDPHAYWTVSRESLCSASYHTPFLGYELPAKVLTTIVNGKVAWES